MHTNQPTNIPQTAGRTNSKLLTFDFFRLTLPQRPLLQRSIEVCLFCKHLRIILIGWEKGAQKWKVSGLITRTILRDSCRKKKIQKNQQHSSVIRKTTAATAGMPSLFREKFQRSTNVVFIMRMFHPKKSSDKKSKSQKFHCWFQFASHLEVLLASSAWLHSKRKRHQLCVQLWYPSTWQNFQLTFLPRSPL